MTRRRAFLQVLGGYLAGVFFWSAIATTALIFLAGVFTDMSTTAARLPIIIGVVLFVAGFVWSQYHFRTRVRLKCTGKNIRAGEAVPKDWIEAIRREDEASPPDG